MRNLGLVWELVISFPTSGSKDVLQNISWSTPEGCVVHRRTSSQALSLLVLLSCYFCRTLLGKELTAQAFLPCSAPKSS